MSMRAWVVYGVILAGSAPAVAGEVLPSGFVVEVLVDGRPARVFAHRGRHYVEAVEGREYEIRLRNPLDERVAVALSVDGLNTIDARRTSAVEARKWVLWPRQTLTIKGWQTSAALARRFSFTTEAASYAQAMGQGDHLGIITAAFFRERRPALRDSTTGTVPQAGERRMEARRAAPTAPAAAAANEFAATGMGDAIAHPVERIHLDLEDTPVSSQALRYEYRAQLIALGVVPPERDRLSRRERASGFEPGFCPDPPRRSRRQNWK